MTRFIHRQHVAVLVFTLTIWDAAICARAQAPAGLGGALALKQVVAIEQADSPVGRYRVVFETTTVLPAVADARSGASFAFDDQPVLLHDSPDDATLHFGYVDRRPAGSATLTMYLTEPDGRRQESRLAVDTAALLARSRPRRGEPEAPHIRRSRDTADLVPAWDASDAAFIGVLMRVDSHPDKTGVWRLSFSVERALRGAPSLAPGQPVVLELSRFDSQYEVGGRYLVLAHMDAAGSLRSDALASVRIWWPERDPVLQFVEIWFDISGATAHAARPAQLNRRAFLFAALSSPAAEVRRTAAAQLGRMDIRGGQLTPDERRLIAARLAREPCDVVKASLVALGAAAESRPR